MRIRMRDGSLLRFRKRFGMKNASKEEIEKAINDKKYLVRKVKRLKLGSFQKYYIELTEARLISVQNIHPLPRRFFLHLRTHPKLSTFIGRDKAGYFIGRL